MRLLLTLSISSFLLAGYAEALLPPFYESTKEFRALLDDKQLEQKLTSGQAILSIARTDTGFKIVTPKYELDIDVVYEKQAMPGPAQFHFVFHDLRPRMLP
jgi:hypothetical protein